MPFYIVKIRREVEFEGVYEAPDQGVAEDLAKLEANHHGEIQDEQIITQDIGDAEVVN